MNCVSCNSSQIKKNGTYKIYQKYCCKNCGMQFSERSNSFFFRHRYPEEIVSFGILQALFLSTRITKFMIKETFSCRVSHTSVYRWTKKFAHLLRKQQRSMSFSNVWHVDEKFVKARAGLDKNGRQKFSYLWIVIDDHNTILATHVSESRDGKNAKIVLRKARTIAGKPPDILVSDGLQSYHRAVLAVLGRKTKHVVAHFKAEGIMCKKKLYYLSNNRIESLNSKVNLWYKKFRGFKSLATARLWCELWKYFYNIMRPRAVERNLISIHEILC